MAPLQWHPTIPSLLRTHDINFFAMFKFPSECVLDRVLCCSAIFELVAMMSGNVLTLFMVWIPMPWSGSSAAALCCDSGARCCECVGHRSWLWKSCIGDLLCATCVPWMIVMQKKSFISTYACFDLNLQILDAEPERQPDHHASLDADSDAPYMMFLNSPTHQMWSNFDAVHIQSSASAAANSKFEIRRLN